MTSTNVLAITSGRHTPSARFRFRQYYPELERLGIHVDESCPLVNNAARLPGPLTSVRIRYLFPLALAQALFNLLLRAPALLRQFQADITWLERHFIPGADVLCVLLRRPYVLDIDDAVWLYNPMGERMVGVLAKRATGIIAGNAMLAAWCRRYNGNVVEIPTAIDCERFSPRDVRDDCPFVLGWTGTSVNFEHLRMIEGPLSTFLASDPTTRLRIVADRRPVFERIPPGQFDFVQWRPEVEADAVVTMHVGLMPLYDTAITRGKCSFKMLQYMASAKPVVVSPVGLNAEILSMAPLGYGPTSEPDWLAAFQDLRRDRGLRDRLGYAGRRVALAHFDTRVVAARLAGFLEECARG